MFESMELVHEISKAEFKKEEPLLRARLIDTQFDLLESCEFPVIVLLGGMDPLGRSAAAKQLLSWMDPRHVRPYALVKPSQEEMERPRMWRFWRALPRKGRIGVFLSGWYDGPARRFFLGDIKKAQFSAHIEEISRFERQLTSDGALLLKFLFMLPKDQHLKTMKKMRKRGLTAWKLNEEEIEISKEFEARYDHAVSIVESMVAETSSAGSPWLPLPSANSRYRDLMLGQTVATAIRDRMAQAASPMKAVRTRTPRGPQPPNILDSLDLGQSLERDDYKKSLEKVQARLTSLTMGKKFEGRSLVMAFEGNDAAGKGGAIRRVVQALDPRMTRVIPIAAPNEEEQAHPYLWRFWRHMPRKGNITIFDRTWYGRVLVERVEGFIPEQDWMRAYEEIRSFESELTDYGVIVVKFWLAIDKKEQLKRFKDREKVGYKRYKITEEDWRNRKKWNLYARAVHDMVDRTSTNNAPWTLVEANDKYFARVKVLKTIVERLENTL